MTKVKMLDSRQGKNGELLEAGKICTIDSYFAKKLIRQNYAEEIKEENGADESVEKLIEKIKSFESEEGLNELMKDIDPASFKAKDKKSVVKAVEDRVKELREKEAKS